LTDASNLMCQCVVAGGGPAGIMTGYLLARAGIDVIVLEKHADFLRDFRGDTIHPSTMDVIGELGLLEKFLELPYQPVRYGEVDFGTERLRLADFTHLPTRCKFVAFTPQWHFLNFIAEEGRRYPTSRLMMNTEALDVKRDAKGTVTGIDARGQSGEFEIAANLVIGADGRHSRLRDAAGLKVIDLGAPMDVLWFKLAYRESEHHSALGRLGAGEALIMLDRGDYWQCALIIRKGTGDEVMAGGLDAFRARVARLAGRDTVDEIASLDEVKLLTVTVDRLEDWCQPGLLFIGDAAHAMSPIGGVGINLAIQDAVAAANLLAEPLRKGVPSLDALHAVQRRRMFPTKVTQKMQTVIQNRIIDRLLASDEIPKVPTLLRVMQHWPSLQRIPGRLIGVGVRPEHVRIPEAAPQTSR
jgi:2-polyprenyl-6-methoxyphenol hydroxylase-like FAD-dependent oxidoreductase